MSKWPLDKYLTTYNQNFIQHLLDMVWNEDVQEGDHTTLSTIPEDAKGKATLYAKASGLVAGLRIAPEIFAYFDPNLQVKTFFEDGAWIKKGDAVFTVSGSVRGILTGERTVLNIIQHLSGIATKSQNWCTYIEEFPTQLMDTRKTTPGLRVFEKWAVALGGAVNHRQGLYDMIMLKDNHIDYSGGIHAAIKDVKAYLAKRQLSIPIVVEAQTLDEVKSIIAHNGIERILLDNMSINELKEAVKLVGEYCDTEASGGVEAENLRPIAETGVDYISTSQLTREIKPLDLSLKMG